MLTDFPPSPPSLVNTHFDKRTPNMEVYSHFPMIEGTDGQAFISL